MKKLLFGFLCLSLLVGCGKSAVSNSGGTKKQVGFNDPTASLNFSTKYIETVKDGGDAKTFGHNGGKPEIFSLAVSEYPSWSVFLVADIKGIINGKEGELSPLEKKWNVDVILKEADYDTCITYYGTKTVDAACLTNMDTIAPSQGRPSVAVLPTSTSVGADTCIVVGIDKIEDLKGIPTYGLEKSVSQFAFEKNLVLKGLNPKDFPFKNMDPAAAAQAVQTGQDGVKSIMVWNPFSLQTIRTNKNAKVIFSSDSMPEEIIDCVMMGEDALRKPGGEAFACCIAEAYYEVNKLIADPATHDETLVAIGSKFSNLPLADMEIIVDQTRFYSTPEAALELFNSSKFQNQTMPDVVKFCVEHDIVSTK